jgi:hypothetical protein
MPHSQTRIVGGVAVFVPTGAVETAAHALAPRLPGVRGARIGILDNCKEFADLVLRGVADVLQREHGAQVKFWRKDYLGKPSPFAQEMAAGCDAVINGVGH